MPKPNPKPVLKLNGKPFELKQQSAAVLKIIKYLESCPPDEIFLHSEVAVKLGFEDRYISHHSSLPELQPYTALAGRNRYVGSRAAITELRRQVGGGR